MFIKSKIKFVINSLFILLSCDQDRQRLSYKSDLDINKEYHVILMAGQSNMVGLGEVKDLENYHLPENIDYFNYSTNTRLKRLLNFTFGPEVELSKCLSEKFPDLNFILIKYAIGGSSINEWLADVESNIDREVDFGDLYKEFNLMINKVTQGYNTNNIALLWMQGETDARYQDTANDYEANFKSLIENFRKDFNKPDLPIIYGKVNSNTKNHKHLDKIQEAQKKIDISLSNTYLINTDNLDKQSDGVHYSSKGLLDLGKLYGEIVSEILKSDTINNEFN